MTYGGTKGHHPPIGPLLKASFKGHLGLLVRNLLALRPAMPGLDLSWVCGLSNFVTLFCLQISHNLTEHFTNMSQ